ncbi:hypothetical protein AB0F91_34440 [Amycolatopsis sp. NPDC023774]|uniref:hypothetical protein n=1 Tax=Amycolatopsis sp. NPDC023774 TaxID=3155015 RepID=UPI0033F47417
MSAAVWTLGIAADSQAGEGIRARETDARSVPVSATKPKFSHRSPYVAKIVITVLDAADNVHKRGPELSAIGSSVGQV